MHVVLVEIGDADFPAFLLKPFFDLLCAFILAWGAVITRAFQLQALEHEKWAAEALEQQQHRVPLPARRGRAPASRVGGKGVTVESVR